MIVFVEFYVVACVNQDGNFGLSHLAYSSQLHLVRVFPAPQRWWAGMGRDFNLAPRGGDGFRPFKPTLSHHTLIMVNPYYTQSIVFLFLLSIRKWDMKSYKFTFIPLDSVKELPKEIVIICLRSLEDQRINLI